MLVTNNTNQDYWFGPLHLPGGIGQTLTVDDTTETSLYLTSDVVADAINNLSNLGKITCTSTASPFPRPTGTPELLHGDGSPEGIVYAGQGSMYMRRDGTGPNSLYTKTTGISISTGWEAFSNAMAGVSFRKTTAKAVTNTVADTDLLNGEITIPANEMGTDGLLRLTAWGDWEQDSGSGSDVMIFTLKLGGTTLLKSAVATPSTGCRHECDPLPVARGVRDPESRRGKQPMGVARGQCHPPLRQHRLKRLRWLHDG